MVCIKRALYSPSMSGPSTCISERGHLLLYFRSLRGLGSLGLLPGNVVKVSNNMVVVGGSVEFASIGE